MLPAGVAVWPGSATQVPSGVWLPSRPTTTIASVSWCAAGGARQTHFMLMNVPQCWLDSDTVEVSKDVPTCDIGCADVATCCGGVEEWPWTPTNTPIPNTTAAADEATQVVTRVRRRRQRTVAHNDGKSSGDISGVADDEPDSAIAATSSRSSWESRAGMPLSSPTASRHAGQLAMCASNSRRSTADNDPSTYAASHIA